MVSARDDPAADTCHAVAASSEYAPPACAADSTAMLTVDDVGGEHISLGPVLADRQLDAILDRPLEEPRAVAQAVAVAAPAARAPPA